MLLSYNIIYRNTCNLIHVINRISYDFYSKNVNKIINYSQYNSETKQDIINSMLDIRISMIKSMLEHENIISEYHRLYISDCDFSKKIVKIISFQNTISKYIHEILSSIDTFNTGYTIESDVPIANKYPNSKDKKRIKKFKKLLEDISDFETYQYQLFFEKKKININNIDSKSNFVKLLNRYLDRFRYAELEIIKIRYANHIDIEYSLSEATENMNNYISKCKKDDDAYPIL